MPDLAFFIGLESEVWQALVDGDRAADERLLDTAFLGVYPSGCCCRTEHADQLQGGPSVAAFALSEARILVLSEDAVVLSYLANWRRASVKGTAAMETMYVSSIWKQTEGAWLNVFSQDTPKL